MIFTLFQAMMVHMKHQEARGENGISHIFCTSRPYLEIGAKMMRNFPSEITFLTLQPFILVDIF